MWKYLSNVFVSSRRKSKFYANFPLCDTGTGMCEVGETPSRRGNGRRGVSWPGGRAQKGCLPDGQGKVTRSKPKRTRRTSHREGWRRLKGGWTTTCVSDFPRHLFVSPRQCWVLVSRSEDVVSTNVVLPDLRRASRRVEYCWRAVEFSVSSQGQGPQETKAKHNSKKPLFHLRTFVFPTSSTLV